MRPIHLLTLLAAAAAEAAVADDCCSAAVAAPGVAVVAAAAAGAVDDAYGDDFGRLVVLWLSVVPSAIEYRQTSESGKRREERGTVSLNQRGKLRKLSNS